MWSGRRRTKKFRHVDIAEFLQGIGPSPQFRPVCKPLAPFANCLFRPVDHELTRGQNLPSRDQRRRVSNAFRTIGWAIEREQIWCARDRVPVELRIEKSR